MAYLLSCKNYDAPKMFKDKRQFIHCHDLANVLRKHRDVEYYLADKYLEDKNINKVNACCYYSLFDINLRDPELYSLIKK